MVEKGENGKGGQWEWTGGKKRRRRRKRKLSKMWLPSIYLEDSSSELPWEKSIPNNQKQTECCANNSALIFSRWRWHWEFEILFLSGSFSNPVPVVSQPLDTLLPCRLCWCIVTRQSAKKTELVATFSVKVTGFKSSKMTTCHASSEPVNCLSQS